MKPFRYELPETIANPRAPQPIGAILPDVLARYGLSTDSITSAKTSAGKNNVRRQNGRDRAKAKGWDAGGRGPASRRSRTAQLSLFQPSDSATKKTGKSAEMKKG